MPEILQIAFHSFLRFSVIFAVGYGLYRLILFLYSHLSGRFSRDRSRETWDEAELLHRVPSSIFGFLLLDILVVWLIAGIASRTTGRLFHISGEIRDSLFLASAAGIFAATVFGIYQDDPPTRLKILGLIACFSALAGIGAG